jgi:hypothetical protein
MDEGIILSPAGTMFSGPDATHLFRAVALRSALKLAKAGIKINRHTTATDLFKMAKEYTGKTYKRGQYDQARYDLTIWIDTMKAAIPIMIEEGHQNFPAYVNGQKIVD